MVRPLRHSYHSSPIETLLLFTQDGWGSLALPCIWCWMVIGEKTLFQTIEMMISSVPPMMQLRSNCSTVISVVRYSGLFRCRPGDEHSFWDGNGPVRHDWPADVYPGSRDGSRDGSFGSGERPHDTGTQPELSRVRETFTLSFLIWGFLEPAGAWLEIFTWAACGANTEGYHSYAVINTVTYINSVTYISSVTSEAHQSFASWQKLVPQVRLAVGILTLSASRHRFVSFISHDCCISIAQPVCGPLQEHIL